MLLLEFGKEVDGSGEVSGLGFPKGLFTASGQDSSSCEPGEELHSNNAKSITAQCFQGC